MLATLNGVRTYYETMGSAFVAGVREFLQT